MYRRNGPRSSYALHVFVLSVMQQCVCETKIRDIDDLHKRMSKTWFDCEHDVIDTAIDR